MNRFIILSLLLISSACSTQTGDDSSEKDRWELRASNIEIIRDDFGVPHIYGKTDADAVFGLLYAQCEDDFPRVERNYLTAVGRRAEAEGAEYLYQDLRAKLYMTEEEAKEKLASSPEWLQSLCEAFADGINYYLYKHPETKPKLLTHFEPWMPMYFSEGSIGGDIERVSTRGIGRFYDPGTEQPVAVVEDFSQQEEKVQKGSNGFAISGAHTESGKAMLLINPHTSFFFRGEVHVVSEEGLNAYGAVTWGQFFVYQGFNERTGWMHTSTGVDVIDDFVETVVKSENGYTYKYGEEMRPVDSLQVTLAVKTDSGLRDRTFTIYRTHHGPITHEENGKWVATALMWNPVEALEQSYLRTKQTGLEGFRKMMDLKTNSSNNTVYADADGNIGYFHGNFIPRRDTTFDYTKPVDGSNPATDWQGLHDQSENIQMVNPENGWLQNCNSTPFTCAGENSPKRGDYPNYMSRYPENFRGIHAISLLKQAQNLSLDGLIELAYDPYLPAAEILMGGLMDAYKNVKLENEDITMALELTRNWDFKVAIDSKPMSISSYYLSTYMRSGNVTVSGRDFIKAVNYMAEESKPSERREIFVEAMENLKNDFGSVETEWGEINRYQRLPGIDQEFTDEKPSIPVGMASATWGALASFGTRLGKNSKRQYGYYGNSFVGVVEFGEKVKAKTLLAGGQSGDPESQHFSDQAQRYADGQFKDIAYYREDVLKRATTTYHPGEEVISN